MTDVSGRNRTQGRFAPEHHPVSAVTLDPAPTPAAVLTGAVDSGKNPNNIPWPEPPARNGYVEVNVNDQDAWAVLELHGFDGDAVENYRQVYAGICLAADKSADFHGVKADGTTEIIALGLQDYEQAVDPDDHENLNYRDGFNDPMPPYLAAQEHVEGQRLAAAASLLEDAGVSVELEDLDRKHFRLRNNDGGNLRLEVDDYRGPKLIETRNWRTADDIHLTEFLGEGYTPAAGELFKDCASLVAKDQAAQRHRAL
mgnify:FL=1